MLSTLMKHGRLVPLLAAALTLACCLGPPLAWFTWRARNFGDVDCEMYGTRLIDPDVELGFKPVANAVSERRHPRAGLAFHIYTTQRGARVGQPGLRTPDQVDLLTVGCSCSWGHGVEGDEAWPLVMGDRLGVRAANLAFPSYGTTQSALMLRRNMDLRPSLVIYGLVDDHVRRNTVRCASNYGPSCLPTPTVAFDRLDRAVVRPPDMTEYPSAERFWRTFIEERHLGPRQVLVAAEADLTAALRRAPQTPLDDSHRAVALAFLVDGMQRSTTIAGTRFVVVRIPDLRPGADTSCPLVVAAALSQVPGLELVDLGPAVSTHYARGGAQLTFEHDTHPNVLAHRLIGELLAQQARARGWLAKPS